MSKKIIEKFKEINDEEVNEEEIVESYKEFRKNSSIYNKIFFATPTEQDETETEIEEIDNFNRHNFESE